MSGSPPSNAYPGHLATGAYSLPSEVLEQIFRFVYDLNKVEGAGDVAMACFKLTDAVIEHSSLFPYCLSYVCSAWNNICLGIPEFWTRVFVDIGLGACSTLQLRRELEASQDNEVNIHVSRCDGFTTEDHLERRRMEAFIKVLSTYAGRYQSIYVETMHRSSLIPLTKHFLKPLPMLKEFYAYSRSSDPELISSQDQIGIGYLRAPRIKSIELDAFLFKHYLLHHWITSGLPSTLRQLTILDISSPNPDHSVNLPLADTLHALDNIPELQKLSFVGINLDPEEIEHVLGHEWDFDCMSYPSLNTLILDNLQPRVAAAILRLISSSARSVVTLGITNSSLSDVDSYYVPIAGNLVLKDIGAADDLQQLLWGSTPRSLTVINCASFNSKAIDKTFSPRLAELVVSGDSIADQLSVASIKKLVAAQLREFEMHQTDEIDFDPVEYVKIQRLNLKGFNIIGNDANYEWLKNNVADFDVSSD